MGPAVLHELQQQSIARCPTELRWAGMVEAMIEADRERAPDSCALISSSAKMARSQAPNSSSLAGSRVTMRRDGLTGWVRVNQKSYAVQSRAVNVVEAAAHRPTERTVASNPMAPAWSRRS